MMHEFDLVAWDDLGDLWCNHLGHTVVSVSLALCFFASALNSEGLFLLVSLLHPQPTFWTAAWGGSEQRFGMARSSKAGQVG